MNFPIFAHRVLGILIVNIKVGNIVYKYYILIKNRQLV